MRRVRWPKWTASLASNSLNCTVVTGVGVIHAAKEIGVSDVALRKHCVKLGIEMPTPGHWARQRRDQMK